MADEERRVLLIIADISGYTQFMTTNAKALAHAQLIITELMETILEGVEYPMEVSKLEGDAVFFYCLIDTDEWADPATHSRLCAQLLNSYVSFADHVLRLTRSHACLCPACSSVDRLRLKMVMHAGTALFHSVGDFDELAGVDVILVHRLLKNEVGADEYVLLTDPAFDELEFPDGIPWQRSSETYPQLGTVATRVYVPQRERQRAREELAQVSLGETMADSISVFIRFAFVAQPIIWGLRAVPTFRNIPQRAAAATRIVQTLVLIITTPLVLAIGIPVVALRDTWRHLFPSA